jgi:hypothetical protein
MSGELRIIHWPIILEDKKEALPGKEYFDNRNQPVAETV